MRTLTAIPLIPIIILAKSCVPYGQPSISKSLEIKNYKIKLSDDLQLSTKNLTALTENTFVINIDPNHYINKSINHPNTSPFAMNIFDTLKNINKFTPYENLITKIVLTVKSLSTSSKPYGNLKFIPTIILMDEQKANAIREDSHRKTFLSQVASYPGFFAKKPISQNNFHEITFDIPDHMQNTNFVVVFNPQIELHQIALEYLRPSEKLPPEQDSSTYNYAKEVDCGVQDQKTQTCKIGNLKPRHIIIKQRFSKNPCYQIVDEQESTVIKRTFNIIKREQGYYIEVSNRCSARFGIDLKQEPNPVTESLEKRNSL